MIVVRSRSADSTRTVSGEQGWNHWLDCGCTYYDVALIPLADGTYVFCANHEAVRLADRKLAS